MARYTLTNNKPAVLGTVPNDRLADLVGSLIARRKNVPSYDHWVEDEDGYIVQTPELERAIAIKLREVEDAAIVLRMGLHP